MQLLRAVLPLVLTLLLAACGSDTTTPSPPTEPTPPTTPVQPTPTPTPTPPTPTPPAPTPPTTANLTGTWGGTTTTQNYGTEQTTFTLVQTGDEVTGSVTLTGTETFESEVIGTVEGISASVVAALSLTEGGSVTYLYQGTVTETTFSGTVTLDFPDGEQDVGEFSVTKGAAAPTPPTDPPTTDVPYGEWAWSSDSASDADFHREGRFSIEEFVFDLYVGPYRECSEGNCSNETDGSVYLTDTEDILNIQMFNSNSELAYEATDSDDELTEDNQGQMVFEGQGKFYDPDTNESVTGSFTAVLTNQSATFLPTE